MSQVIRRVRHVLLLTALLGVALQAGPAAALDPRWMPFGPGGGTVTSLALDPQDSQRLYAATPGGLYRSGDGGQTWALLFRPLYLAVVAVDPSRPSTLYAAGPGIFRSGDGGLTWRKVLDRSDLEVTSLTLTSGRSPVILAVSRGTVLRSSDGGATWTTVVTAPGAGSLAASPREPGTVYLGHLGGVLKSVDAGLSWTEALRLDESDPSIALIAVAPSAPRMVYAIGNTGQDFSVWRSVDAGTSWQKVKIEPGFFPSSLVVDPKIPTRLYLGGFRGVARSDDGGRIWHPINKGLSRTPFGTSPQVYSLAVDPRHGRTVFAGLWDLGVARSDDAGGQWSIPQQLGLSAAWISVLAFNPLAPDEVYVALTTKGERGFRSTDGGRTWSFLPRQITRLGLRDLAFDPTDPAVLYAATGTGVLRSEDRGASWNRLLGGYMSFVATAGPGVVLTAWNCGLLRSVDGGHTWSEVIPCFDSADDELFRVLSRPWTNPVEPNLIYAQGIWTSYTHPYGTFVLRSTDGGATWSELPLPNPDLFAVAPGNSQVLYAWQDRPGTLQRSQDGGRTWQVVNNQRPNPPWTYRRLVVDATDPDTIYLVSGDRLLRSRDGGRTLETFDPSAAPMTVITDRARPGTLFLLPAGGGLFERQVEE